MTCGSADRGIKPRRRRPRARSRCAAHTLTTKISAPRGRQTSVRRHQDEPRRYDLGFTVLRHTTESLDDRFGIHAPRNAPLAGHRCLTLFSRYAQRKRVGYRSKARTTGTAYKAVSSACCCRKIEIPTQQNNMPEMDPAISRFVRRLASSRASLSTEPFAVKFASRWRKTPRRSPPLGPIARANVTMQAMVLVSHVDQLRIPDYQAPITRFSARNLGRRFEVR
jgi:hypothetical protein